jgi:hypothetical protein
MTAPPAMQMPLPTFDPYLNIASPYISPSTITSESSFSWVTMPPHQEPSREYKFLRFSLIIDMVRHTLITSGHWLVLSYPCATIPR